MNLSRYLYLIKSDLFRYTGKITGKLFIRNILFNPSFKYSFWMRSCCYLRNHKFLKFGFYHIAKFILFHYTYKYGISIYWSTSIDSGFYIGHFTGIIVNPNTVIGKNCNISHGVTLGRISLDRNNPDVNNSAPVIGDNVYIGPGAKLIGNIHVGNNTAIGANCVVTKDIPDNAVVVGVPGKVISYNGSNNYINRKNYNDFLDYQEIK